MFGFRAILVTNIVRGNSSPHQAWEYKDADKAQN